MTPDSNPHESSDGDEPQPVDPIEQRWWLRRWLNRMEMDRATFYVVATRVWRLSAGLVTASLIASYFSKAVQGYYFSFWSVLNFQALVELGISGVIIQSATHEWSDLWLDDGKVAGNAERREHLAAICQYFDRWFFRASLAFIAVLSLFGLWFFSAEPPDATSASLDVQWKWPWLAVTVASGFSLMMTPKVALLEGCGQIAAVNRMRLLQMVAGNLGVWLTIVLGLNLWVAVVAAGIQVGGELALLRTFRRFFGSLPKVPRERQPRDWQALLRPMQTRLGFQTAVKFFANNMLTPIIFRYQGAEAAGPVGLTWNLLKSLQHATFAWVQTRGPLFGQYVARKEYQRLDQVFRRLAMIATLLMMGGAIAASGGVALLQWLPGKIPAALASRMLDAPLTALIGATFTLNLIATAMGLYLSAHRRAPLVWITTSCDLLTAVLVWHFGRTQGVTPAVLAMFAVSGLLLLPGATWMWLRCRRLWHND